MHKKILIVLFFIFWALPTFAQVDTAWVRRYNGPGNGDDAAHAVAVDDLGNVYVTGSSGTIKYDAHGNQIWVGSWGGYDIALDDSSSVYVTGRSADSNYVTVKYDSSGNELWVRTYNDPADRDDCACCIAVDGSGNVYVTGWSWSGYNVEYGTGWDYATIKYDSSGNEVWVRRYSGVGWVWWGETSDWAVAIGVDNYGNVFVTGLSADSVASFDYATIKYDPNGTEVWVRRYNGPANSWDQAYAIAVDTSGNVYVTGGITDSSGGQWYSDYATIKYGPNGTQLWVRTYNGPGNGEGCAYALAVDDSNNVYVTGIVNDGGTDQDYGTIKYYPDGEIAWVSTYDGGANNDDLAVAITVDDSGNVYVTGRSVGIGWDYATIKYDSSGNELWVQRYNGPGNGGDKPSEIAVDDHNNVYVTGPSVGSGTGKDYATIKYVQNFWTILVYLNGDNDLESAAIEDINEMEMADSSGLVTIVVQVDRTPGYDGTNGDWTDTRRYLIVHDSDPNVINSIRLDTLPPLGELNMGDPQTLVDFVNWGLDNYPASSYAVIVWDHGDGWYKKPFGDGFYQDDIVLKGMSFDDTDGDNIGVSDGDWESAISQIRDHLGRNINLVGFDACLMQMWEVME